MKEILLTQGKIALVDDEDYERLMQWKWCVHKCKGILYAARNVKLNGKRITFHMHREVLYFKYNDRRLIDHKNKNGLDNRKENLRSATSILNGWNCKISKRNSSGYRGVSWIERDKIWRSQIQINGKMKNCGSFSTAIKAALEYDRMAIITRKENAILNFPISTSSPEQPSH